MNDSSKRKPPITNNICWKLEHGGKKQYYLDGKPVKEYDIIKYFISRGLSSSFAHREIKKIKQRADTEI